MELSLILNLVILVILLIVTLGFVFYKKIVRVSLLAVQVIFSLSLFMVVVTLFAPQLYSQFVENNFSQTVLAQDLKSVDKTLTQLTTTQINITNTINGILNNGAQNLDKYESNVYSQVVSFMAGALRIFIIILGLVILIFSLYIRYSFSGSVEVSSLQRQIDELKKEVKLLKQVETKVY